jgi:diacylglycerol kinase family enzyme/membrane-associated phospholipid phosphatase
VRAALADALLAAILLATLLGGLIALVRTGWGPLARLDESVSIAATGATRGEPALVALWLFLDLALDPVTFHVLVGIVAIVLLVRRPHGRISVYSALAAVAGMAVGQTASTVLKEVVGRARPMFDQPLALDVDHSLPSGHAVGSMLGCGVLLALGWHLLGTTAARVTAVTLAVVVVVVTGWDRVALGLHYPSDVLAGWLIALTVLAVAWPLLRAPGRLAPAAAETVEVDVDLRPRAAVVVNPTKVDDLDALRAEVTGWMAVQGWDAPLWLETTTEDTGRRATLRAVEEGVDVVLACGGDGTVMAVVSGVAGSGVPLGVLPQGTGNLLARNLDLPDDLETAVLTGLLGDDRPVDVGRVWAADLPEGYRFAVMAGMGFDAALVADAPEGLKRALGWPAYVVSGVRHMFDRPMRITLRLDGGEPLSRRPRTVLVGNVGRLQGGLLLLPDARPDDGVLDVVLVATSGPVGWLRVVGRVLLRRRKGFAKRPSLEHFTACRVEIESDRPQPRQLDGDPIGAGTTLCLEMEHHALLVRVPAAGPS